MPKTRNFQNKINHVQHDHFLFFLELLSCTNSFSHYWSNNPKTVKHLIPMSSIMKNRHLISDFIQKNKAGNAYEVNG